ncbi:hypothetical protein [Halobacterium salinarum]|uniref:hypothetical protein n=1 Tax=Halobacterium salinarum TaxID=2242 RepID=UPI001F20BF0A|nr:hypothetical protein [Halobacterium salinarum]
MTDSNNNMSTFSRRAVLKTTGAVATFSLASSTAAGQSAPDKVNVIEVRTGYSLNNEFSESSQWNRPTTAHCKPPKYRIESGEIELTRYATDADVELLKEENVIVATDELHHPRNFSGGGSTSSLNLDPKIGQRRSHELEIASEIEHPRAEVATGKDSVEIKSEKDASELKPTEQTANQEQPKQIEYISQKIVGTELVDVNGVSGKREAPIVEEKRVSDKVIPKMKLKNHGQLTPKFPE